MKYFYIQIYLIFFIYLKKVILLTVWSHCCCKPIFVRCTHYRLCANSVIVRFLYQSFLDARFLPLKKRALRIGFIQIPKSGVSFFFQNEKQKGKKDYYDICNIKFCKFYTDYVSGFERQNFKLASFYDANFWRCSNNSRI